MLLKFWRNVTARTYGFLLSYGLYSPVGRLSKLLIWKLRGLVGFANLSASINAAINLGFYGNFRIFLSEINPVEYARLRMEPRECPCENVAHSGRGGGGGEGSSRAATLCSLEFESLDCISPRKARLGSNDLVVPAGTTAGKRRNRNAPVKGAILRYFKRRIRLSSAFQPDTYRCYGTSRVCTGIG